MKKIISILLAALLACGAVSASAEDALTAILGAGTTQAFTDEAVDVEDLNAILEAGLSAASAMNQQPWYFAVVTNAEIMDEIAGSMSFGGAGERPEGMEQPEGLELPEDMELPENFEAPEGMEIPEGEAMPERAASAMPAGGGSAKAALGDSPVAVIIYMDESASTNASFDCGLACQNMVIAASALGYGTKIVSSPTMALNGENHDALCETLGVDSSLSAVAVLLIGHADDAVDGATGATTRSSLDEKTSFVE